MWKRIERIRGLKRQLLQCKRQYIINKHTYSLNVYGFFTACVHFCRFVCRCPLFPSPNIFMFGCLTFSLCSRLLNHFWSFFLCYSATCALKCMHCIAKRSKLRTKKGASKMCGSTAEKKNPHSSRRFSIVLVGITLKIGERANGWNGKKV